MSSDKKDQRSLSSKKRGYLLAILGGTLGLPVGWVVSPLVLFGLNRTMKEKDGKKPNVFKRWALIGIVGAPLCFSTSVFIADGEFQRKVDRCNNGKDEGCEALLEQYSSRLNINKEDRDKVTNPVAIPFLEKNLEEFKLRNEQKEKEKAAELKAEQEEQKKTELAKAKAKAKANATYRANACIENKGGENCLGIKTELIDADLLAKAQRYIDTQKIIEEDNKAAEAKFKAEGWWEKKPGIFVKWCKNASNSYPKRGDCPYTDTYMDSVWRMMVWCKERSCGNIYAKINILQGSDGPVVGWTNDTAYGDYGQKVVLTFQTSSNGNTASLVEFKTY